MLVLASTGIVLGVWGFSEKNYNFSDSLYKTFQLFVLKVSVEELKPLWQLQWSMWLIFAAFLWATFRLFFEIIAPQFLKNLKTLTFRNHIIICGLNKITVNLVENLAKKHQKKQIIILAEDTNKYADMLKVKCVELFIGNFTDESFWKKIKLEKASKLYAITDNDSVNAKIAQSVFSYLEGGKREKDALKSFVLIKDRELKTILEESVLFKYKTVAFDGIPFNINEIGMKYGVATYIDKILPKAMQTPPEILLIGLTEKTEIALLNLAHCFTMQREIFRFTIVEKDAEKIHSFQKKYPYLQDFIEIKIIPEIEPEKTFDSVLVCTDCPMEAVKKAVAIRYLLGVNFKDKSILLFCNEADTFNEILKNELENKKIFPVSLFRQIADYVFELDRNIEEKAKETHYFWNTIYGQNKEWDELTGHFKQSNRNQILDNYLKIYIARGEKFENAKNRLISFSDSEKETLAIMEHRRWVLEKIENGWVLGERDNEFKRHNCLIHWKELSQEEQAKDYDTVNLMIRLLNNSLIG